jgi:hypothetical protein
MFTDQRYRGTAFPSRAHVSHHTWRQFISKKKIKINPTRLKHGVNLGYESHGAYAHLGNVPNESLSIFKGSSKTIFFNDPLRLSAPYNYFANAAKEPSDNVLRSFLELLGILGIFAGVLVVATMRIHKHAAFPQNSPTRFSRVSLAISELQESPDNSFSFNSDGLPFVIDNSATCIICNNHAQFVWNLKAKKLSAETTHGSASTNYVGTFSLTLTTDDGEKLQHHIPDAIFNPNSPFNILGIPFFGQFLGRGDLPCPTNDNDGTYVQSSATRSCLVWDHGKYKCHFTHDNQCLPILQLNMGFSYYQAFCSRVNRAYDDVVHYAFLASHLI